MDSSLKQRLVGAVILVVLIVLIVPELLRGKAPPATGMNDVPPRAQPEGSAGGDVQAPLRSVTVDMREPMGSTEVSPSNPQPAAAPASAASATPVVPAPQSQPPPVADPASAPPAETMAPPPATAVANLPKPVPNGPWVVQLGSFALKVSAERLARELKDAGYPAYVSPVRRGARELFRVRVGPMADRQAASRYYTALQAAGKDVAIVPNR